MRMDNDDWDITTSVGLTALAVAAARAIETTRPDGLAEDPLAEAFVAAAGAEVTMPVRAAAEPPSDDDMSPEAGWSRIADYLAIRTRFFDEYFADATAAGIDQVVLLAAGLDTRAQRLSWPERTDLYEIDREQVLSFKDAVLADRCVPAACERHVVPVDLRHDWPARLLQASFDPARPTAWLAEGLLPYLPADAQDGLLARVQELSAPGSRLALEHLEGSETSLMTNPMLCSMQGHFGVDAAELLYDDDRRADPRISLLEDGWIVASVRAEGQAMTYGRPIHPELRDVFGRALLVRGRLPCRKPPAGRSPRRADDR